MRGPRGHGEAGTRALRVCDCQVAAKKCGDAAGDGEAEAVSLDAGAVVQPREFVEYRRTKCWPAHDRVRRRRRIGAQWPFANRTPVVEIILCNKSANRWTVEELHVKRGGVCTGEVT